jgi:hypothetical protein
MALNIDGIFNRISDNPELYDILVSECLKQNPDATAREIHACILSMIADQHIELAADDVKRRQKDVIREIITSKALSCLPDIETVNKVVIKKTIWEISSSGITYQEQREIAADLLKKCSGQHTKQIKIRKDATEDLGRRKKHGK